MTDACLKGVESILRIFRVYICWILEFDAFSVPIRNSAPRVPFKGTNYSNETWEILRSAVSVLIYLLELCTLAGGGG